MMAERVVEDAASILVVDDCPSVREFLERVFLGKGGRVLTAANGQHALTIASREKPDVVLLDLKMPGLGGLEVLQRLLQMDTELIVIVMTGYGCIESARQAMRLGAYDYLTKPFDPDLLQEVVAESLSPKMAAPAHTARGACKMADAE